MYVQTHDLSVIPAGVRPIIHVSQYDNQQEALRFLLYKENALFPVPAVASAVIEGRKPDGTAFIYSAVTINGNAVVFDLTQQMTAVYGDVLCELRVRTTSEIVGTINFILRVEEAPLHDDSVLSDTEIPLIEQAVDIAANLAEYIQQTLDARDEAVASAEAAADSAEDAATDAASAASDAASVQELYDSIETAKSNANAAAEAANNAAEALENISAVATTLAPGSQATASYSNGVLTLGIPRGLTGDSGVGVPTSGIFWLYVDDVGNLYVVFNNPAEPPRFAYDAATGNLYYLVGSVKATLTGASPLTVPDAAEGPVMNLYFTLSLAQGGSGTPSPSNVRSISTKNSITYSVNSAEASESFTAMPAGTFDPVTGVRTVTHATKTFNGGSADTWTTYTDGSGHTIFQSTIANMDASVSANDGLCDRLAYDRTFASNFTYALARNTVSVRCDAAATVAAFKTWLASNPLTFAYKLATPQTATVTGSTIELTEGENTIETSWDTITVEYITTEEDE